MPVCCLMIVAKCLGDMYTLDGRRANASVKGIVIQDGKKVVKK